jgi:hypothetical protein
MGNTSSVEIELDESFENGTGTEGYEHDIEHDHWGIV